MHKSRLAAVLAAAAVAARFALPATAALIAIDHYDVNDAVISGHGAAPGDAWRTKFGECGVVGRSGTAAQRPQTLAGQS